MKKEGMKMALKALSEEMHGMMGNDYKSGLEEKLKPKKMMAVQVAADSKENLKKGLSNAEKLLKAKEMSNMEEDSDMEDEEVEESCPECEGKGCDKCEESSEEIPSEEDLKNMSKEELLALLLKKEDSDKE